MGDHVVSLDVSVVLGTGHGTNDGEMRAHGPVQMQTNAGGHTYQHADFDAK